MPKGIDAALEKKGPEAVLQAAVVDLFRYSLPRQIWHSIPNEAKRTGLERAIMSRLGLRAGVADLVVVRDALYLELKAGRNKLTESQERFRDDCQRAGIAHVEIRSLDEAKAAVDSYGLLAGGRRR